MARPLRRAAWVCLALAACTRPHPSAPPPSARGSAPPALLAAVGSGAPDPAAPSPCLPAERQAPADLLAAEGRDALAAGDAARALACADAALRLSPRLAGALTVRAMALVARSRLDEGRLAFARALAVDPNDPETLLGAAELHVRHLGPSRDALEAALEYALRGARAAQVRKDRVLAARLVLVAAMAENDLGRSHLALPRLERALAALPEDPDVLYERGVSLFELCRFDEAQRSFERALALAPDDAWTLYQLGLLAERRGDDAAAADLMARARRLAPDRFRRDLDVDAAAFRREVDSAIATLPPGERRALEAVPIEIADLPDTADLLAVEPPLSPSILGLFRGPPEGEPCTEADGPKCRAIVIYRKNLLRFSRDRRELSEQIRVTLLHELGHLHGEDDEDLRTRGLE